MANRLANLRQFEGPQLTHLLHGKTVKSCWTDGQVLVIQFNNGHEMRVAWVTEDGKPVKGRPAIDFAGLQLRSSIGAALTSVANSRS